VEDYGDSTTEDYTWDLKYLEESINWTLEPPPVVLMNGQFCNCPQRYLWKPTAVIDAIEYNWPRIDGRFNTDLEYPNAYKNFHETYINHMDPVCFYTTIFCDFLHYMRINYKVVIDVNQFNIKRPKIYILVKLQYLSLRWQRVLEVMAIIHFLI